MAIHFIIFVVFNALSSSQDTNVNNNSFTQAQFNFYVIGKLDWAYNSSPDSSDPGKVKDVRGDYEGGMATWVLRPQKKIVYAKTFQLVDAATAWFSAENSTNAITKDLPGNLNLPSGWPSPPGFQRADEAAGRDVPSILDRLVHPPVGAPPLCGQCMVYAGITGALTRSIGIPNRMVTTVNSIVGTKNATGSWTWNFHVWNEAWLNELAWDVAETEHWAAHDASMGSAFGTNVTSVLPTKRIASSFAIRFGKGVLGAGGPANETRAFTTTGTTFFGLLPVRKIVTGCYVPDPATAVDPSTGCRQPKLSDPSGTTSPVTVSFTKPTYAFGQNITAKVSVANNGTSTFSTSLNFLLGAESIEGLNLRGPWAVFNVTTSIIVPPGNNVTVPFNIPASSYLLNGGFVGMAKISPQNNTALARVTVSPGINTTITGSESIPAGTSTTYTAKVKNILPTTVHNINVTALVPGYLNATGPTDVFIPTLAPNATFTFTFTLKPPSSGSDVIELSAVSNETGASLTRIVVTVFVPTDFRLDWADWDNSGVIDILDLAQTAFCFDKTSNSTLWTSCKYWDFNLQNKITILDIAIVAFYFDTHLSAGYPGQGLPPAQMDPYWKTVCSQLPQPDQNYCNQIP